MITIAFWLLVLSAGLCVFIAWTRSRAGKPITWTVFVLGMIIAALIGVFTYLNAH